MKRYLDYLREKVGVGGRNGLPYLHLTEWLFDQPFIFSIEGDENRDEDGMLQRVGYSDAPKESGSRVLEVMVSICEDMQFIAGGLVPDDINRMSKWFNGMLMNLGISSLTDDIWSDDPSGCEDYADQQVGIWLRREYDFDGSGGIFPLQKPKDDQAKVELWYQMNAYLSEMVFLSE